MNGRAPAVEKRQLRCSGRGRQRCSRGKEQRDSSLVTRDNWRLAARGMTRRRLHGRREGERRRRAAVDGAKRSACRCGTARGTASRRSRGHGLFGRHHLREAARTRRSLQARLIAVLQLEHVGALELATRKSCKCSQLSTPGDGAATSPARRTSHSAIAFAILCHACAPALRAAAGARREAGAQVDKMLAYVSNLQRETRLLARLPSACGRKKWANEAKEAPTQARERAECADRVGRTYISYTGSVLRFTVGFTRQPRSQARLSMTSPRTLPGLRNRMYDSYDERLQR